MAKVIAVIDYQNMGITILDNGDVRVTNNLSPSRPIIHFNKDQALALVETIQKWVK